MRQMTIWDDFPEAMPMEPKQADVKGILDDPYCPTCGSALYEGDQKCDCGQPILWDFWKSCNQDLFEIREELKREQEAKNGTKQGK